MDSISPDVVTLCAIALGVGLLILLAALLMLQVLRGSIFGIAMMLMRMLTQPKEEGADKESDSPRVSSQSAVRKTQEMMRARADSLDFDAAVARYRGQSDDTQAQSAEAAPPPTQPLPPTTTLDTTQPLYQRPLRGHRPSKKGGDGDKPGS
jgi:hypothetical protein